MAKRYGRLRSSIGAAVLARISFTYSLQAELLGEYSSPAVYSPHGTQTIAPDGGGSAGVDAAGARLLGGPEEAGRLL